MTGPLLKLASLVLALTCAVHAAPLSQGCVGDACHQVASSGSVSLGSSTKIVPVTEVTPITRYQPIIQSYAPVVQSACPPDIPLSEFRNPMGDPGFMSLRRGPAEEMMIKSAPRLRGAMTTGGTINRFAKRAKKEVSAEQCIPSATQTCEQTVPGSTTDMGSDVTATPSNVVLPSTVYQGHVQSKGPEIEAAAAESKQLSQSNVNLASDTRIEPVTKVFPETTYQPSVEQKATMIEADVPESQSLGRSSVSLGSSVTVRPTTTVEPLTVFQPKIKSLPFIIHDEGCAPVIYRAPKEMYKYAHPAC
ncbi:hypothetical protein BGZ70_002532 [Mortierella alpina]|uniref:Uncharacterized protein n=1 Tax=Mortierella alpina TaxID=64518 RepID=A0A9P6M5B4_MORAP|nr:hypothetical protein BGZ70_002532 [Mortierella alpina]